MNDAIVEAIALTRTETKNNAVLVKTQLSDGLPLVQGDRVQLQQALLNLIINAVEAMCGVSQEERELLISTGNETNGVLVEVRCPGLAPATVVGRKGFTRQCNSQGGTSRTRERQRRDATGF